MRSIKVNKNRVILYCLFFGILMVSIVSVIFVITNTIITEKQICDDLIGNNIYIGEEKYILSNENIDGFSVDKRKEKDPYREREVEGVLTIKYNNNTYNLPMVIKYRKVNSNWRIMNIFYNSN